MEGSPCWICLPTLQKGRNFLGEEIRNRTMIAALLGAILSVTFTVAADMSGCVVSIDGKPVAGAEITVYRPEGLIFPELPVITKTRSDEAGLYLLEHDLAAFGESRLFGSQYPETL